MTRGEHDVAYGRLLEEFDDAWRTDNPPCIADFLESRAQQYVQSSDFVDFVWNLVMVDLERRWLSTSPGECHGLSCRPSLEDYQRIFPILARADQVPQDAINHEYVIRTNAGDKPALDAYRRRFGRLPAHPDSTAAPHSSSRCCVCWSRLLETTSTERKSQVCSACSTLTNGREFLPNTSADVTHAHAGQRYRLQAPLGRGAFGEVWQTWDKVLERFVALKIPRDDSQGKLDKQRLVREATAVAKLKHPGIVPVYDVGVHHGVTYVACEQVDGVTLDEWVHLRETNNSTPITPWDAAHCCELIAVALHHAHQHGVIHRDLKPSNILIDAEGKPRITDFGLALRIDDNGRVPIAGEVVGTLAYMPPEQARGDSDSADARSDIYALGVILYELLTGERPYRGKPRYVMRQIMEDAPPEMKNRKCHIPRDLRTICLKCLNKAPEDRYQSAHELALDLGRFQRREPIHARPAPWWDRASKWVRRRPAAATLLGVFALLLLSGTYGLLQELERRREEQAYISAKMDEIAVDLSTLKAGINTNSQNLQVVGEFIDQDKPCGEDPLNQVEHALASIKREGEDIAEEIANLQAMPAAPNHPLDELATQMNTLMRQRNKDVARLAFYDDKNEVISRSYEIKDTMAEAADGALLYVIQMRLLEGLMPVNESDELRQQVLSTIDTTLGQLKTFFDDNHLQDGDLIRPLREQLYHDLILRHYVAQLGQNPEDGNIGQSNSATLDPHLFRARQIREGLQLQPSIGELFLTKSLPPDDAQNLAMSHEHVLDYLILTDSAIRRGSPEEAIDCLETVLSNPIDYFWPQILMALLCLHCDKNLEALEAVAACKQVSPAPQGPRLAFVHILAAQAEYRLARTQTGDERRRNYEHAIGELQQAQDLLSDISTHQEHNRKYLYVTHIQRGSMQLSEYLHLYHYPTDDSLPSWDDDAQSRLRRAKEDIALAADICPDDYLSSFYLARIHDLLGENDDAKWYYEKSLDQGPPTDDSFDVHFHFGMFHQKRREYDEAIEQFRLAEEASQPERQVLPNDTQRASREVTNRVACLVQQARCLMDKASLLESASPKTAQTHLERAKRLYRAAYNRVKEIPELYLSVGKSGEPSERAVLLKLEAEILFRTCRIQPATPEARDKIIALLDEFLSIAPNDADAFALRAITRLQRRDARLWADLRQAANEQQRDDAIRRSLEDIPAIAADFDAAISRYPDQPNTANPRMHLVHYGRGMTRMLLGEWKSAEADFSKAIVLGDGDSKTYARIGRAIALANAGEVDDAMNEADGVAAIIQAESDPSRELALNAAEVYVHISNAVGRDAAQRETWREDCGRCLNSAVDLLAHLMKRLPRTRTQRLWQELEEQHQVLHKGLLQNERYQRILLIERNRTREPSDA